MIMKGNAKYHLIYFLRLYFKDATNVLPGFLPSLLLLNIFETSHNTGHFPLLHHFGSRIFIPLIALFARYTILCQQTKL